MNSSQTESAPIPFFLFLVVILFDNMPTNVTLRSEIFIFEVRFYNCLVTYGYYIALLAATLTCELHLFVTVCFTLWVFLDEWRYHYEDTEHCYYSSDERCETYFIWSHPVIVLIAATFQTIYIRNFSLRCDCFGHNGGCHFVAALSMKLKGNGVDRDEMIIRLKANLVRED